MIKRNCEEKNFIKLMEDKADLNVGNETQLLMMSTYQSMKMYGYTDTYGETYIYV